MRVMPRIGKAHAPLRLAALLIVLVAAVLPACDRGAEPTRAVSPRTASATSPASAPADDLGFVGGDRAAIVNRNCPVSGEPVDLDASEVATYTYRGKVYGFCCAPCIEDFKANPAKYVKAE